MRATIYKSAREMSAARIAALEEWLAEVEKRLASPNVVPFVSKPASLSRPVPPMPVEVSEAIRDLGLATIAMAKVVERHFEGHATAPSGPRAVPDHPLAGDAS
jgi:hypothetical protein